MADEPRPAEASAIARITSIAKDMVAVLRDASLFVLALLLVAFPAQFNAMLVQAGFEEGSVVGFKWKSKLVESNRALEDAQQTISRLQGKNDELLKALNDANSRSGNPQLLEQLARLEQENKALKTATQTVQARVSETLESNIPLVEKALSSTAGPSAPARSRGEFTVGLQTLGVEDGERIALNEALRNEGFGLDTVTYAYPASQRPSWFADRSTVFHYAASSRPMAEQLAQSMKAKTGQDFVVRRGSGLGVDPARKEVTLFVHFVKGR